MILINTAGQGGHPGHAKEGIWRVRCTVHVCSAQCPVYTCPMYTGDSRTVHSQTNAQIYSYKQIWHKRIWGYIWKWFMVAFLTVHWNAKKASGAFMAVANLHINPGDWTLCTASPVFCVISASAVPNKAVHAMQCPWAIHLVTSQLHWRPYIAVLCNVHVQCSHSM